MAKHLQREFNIKKILILDWDAHAANGTMDVFYEDPTVLNISIHQDPISFYPGTGFMEQIGNGEGRGYTVNIPVPTGSGNSDYIYILNEFVIPIARSYKPDMIAISTGFDSHSDDFISGLQLTEEGYGLMTQIMVDLADKLCNGKLTVELEGGYNLEATARSSYAMVNTLIGIAEIPEEKIEGNATDSVARIVKQLKEIFSDYHTLR